MSTTPTTTWGWVYELVNKVGFPIALILLAWFRFLEPGMQKHFEQMDATQRMQAAQVEIDRDQTKLLEAQAALLSAIKSDSGETTAWTRLRAQADREQLEILKRIERSRMN